MTYPSPVYPVCRELQNNSWACLSFLFARKMDPIVSPKLVIFSISDVMLVKNLKWLIRAFWNNRWLWGTDVSINKAPGRQGWTPTHKRCQARHHFVEPADSLAIWRHTCQTHLLSTRLHSLVSIESHLHAYNNILWDCLHVKCYYL